MFFARAGSAGTGPRCLGQKRGNLTSSSLEGVRGPCPGDRVALIELSAAPGARRDLCLGDAPGG